MWGAFQWGESQWGDARTPTEYRALNLCDTYAESLEPALTAIPIMPWMDFDTSVEPVLESVSLTTSRQSQGLMAERDSSPYCAEE